MASQRWACRHCARKLELYLNHTGACPDCPGTFHHPRWSRGDGERQCLLDGLDVLHSDAREVTDAASKPRRILSSPEAIELSGYAVPDGDIGDDGGYSALHRPGSWEWQLERAAAARVVLYGHGFRYETDPAVSYLVRWCRLLVVVALLAIIAGCKFPYPPDVAEDGIAYVSAWDFTRPAAAAPANFAPTFTAWSLVIHSDFDPEPLDLSTLTVVSVTVSPPLSAEVLVSSPPATLDPDTAAGALSTESQGIILAGDLVLESWGDRNANVLSLVLSAPAGTYDATVTATVALRGRSAELPIALHVGDGDAGMVPTAAARVPFREAP